MDESAIWTEKLKIHELCARYTLRIDAHDIEGWANTFTEDGVFGYGDRAIVGRAKIAAYGHVHKTLASRHLNTSLLFDIDPSGERATGTSATVVTVGTSRGYRVAFLGRYDDELRKVDGAWLFARRWVSADRLPAEATSNLPVADAEVSSLIQPLLDAYERLGEKVDT